MAKFAKGQSGNPGGRPKETAEVRALARQYAPQAIEALVEIMSDRSSRESARVAAASAILDRGLGKPTQEITADIKDTKIDPDDLNEIAKRMKFLIAMSEANQNKLIN